MPSFDEECIAWAKTFAVTIRPFPLKRRVALRGAFEDLCCKFAEQQIKSGKPRVPPEKLAFEELVAAMKRKE